MLSKIINLEGTTRGTKISSKGFGLKRDEEGYFNSSSLSLLNEKTVAMIYNCTVRGNVNQYVFEAGLNNITFTLERVNNSTVFAEVLTFKMECYNAYKPFIFNKPVYFQIAYKQSYHTSEVVGEKAEGLIKKYTALDGNTYYIAFQPEPIKKPYFWQWYYAGYSIKLLK